MTWQEQLRAAQAATDRAIKQRQAELQRFADQAEARGRQVYADAIKTGERVLARTPAEVRALGIAAARGQLPQALGEMAVRKAVTKAAPLSQKSPAHAPRVKAHRPAAPTRSVERELEAGVSGLVDEASFGLADPLLAAGNAVRAAWERGDTANLVGDYRASMEEKAARDEYDAQHHGLSRNVGRGVGVAGSMLAMGAPGAVRALAFAIPKSRGALQAAELGLRYAPDARGLTSMMALHGAGTGLAGQIVGDTLTGRRSNPAETAGAVLSGAVGGVVDRFTGPVVGGALSGAASSVATDVTRGQLPSVDAALNAAQTGAILGKVGGSLGARRMKAMPVRDKGRLGERLSNIKSELRGDEILGTQRRVYLQPHGPKPLYTIADGVSLSRGNRLTLTEAKAGTEATLTDNQIRALEQYGDDYIVDYWRPSDIGKFTGRAAEAFGSPLFEDQRHPVMSR